MTRKHDSKFHEIVETTIENLSHDGRGVSHIEGKTTFVLGALANETVKIRRLRHKRRYDEAEITEVINASPLRAQAPCPHYLLCGGCSLQHLQTDAQIRMKQQILLEQLQHFGKQLVPKTLLSPLTAATLAYRRKARLGVKYVIKKERVLVGFREKSSRYLADIDSCAVLHPSVGNRIQQLKQFISTLDAFRSIPQIEVAVGDNTTALIFRHMETLSAHDLASLRHYAETENIHLYLQPAGLDSVHRLWPEEGEERLSFSLPQHQIEFLFHPNDFVQINAEINCKMVDQAISLLKPGSNDNILDLFCGLGNFSLPIAKHAKQVTGVEGSEKMVTRAKENALHNAIHNTQFHAADLTQDISNQEWAQQTYNKLIIDPPRSGALELIKQLPVLQAQQILYISCNPATLARDAQELVHEQGFSLATAGVIDMFPHTQHTESMALFIKE